LPQSRAHRRLSTLEKPGELTRGPKQHRAETRLGHAPVQHPRGGRFVLSATITGRDGQRGHRFARQATTSVGFDDATECGELRILREKSPPAPNDLAHIATWDLFYDVQWEFILNYLPGPSVLSHKFV
jgi:hypothetical protein